MSLSIVLSASPSSTSRSLKLANSIAKELAVLGARPQVIDIKTLPPGPLLAANTHNDALAASLALIEAATSVVVVSPVYKAAYSGLLKVFLDCLPQHGLQGKVVLPVLTGGSPAHFLTIDYALRPVLSSMAPDLVLGGLYVVDKQIAVSESGDLALPEDIQERLGAALRRLVDWPPRLAPSVIAAQ